MRVEFAVIGAEELNAAAGGRRALVAQDEKRDAVRDQHLDTVAVPARRRVERLQLRFQLVDQGDSLWAVRTFARDDRRHELARAGIGQCKSPADTARRPHE